MSTPTPGAFFIDDSGVPIWNSSISFTQSEESIPDEGSEDLVKPAKLESAANSASRTRGPNWMEAELFSLAIAGAKTTLSDKGADNRQASLEATIHKYWLEECRKNGLQLSTGAETRSGRACWLKWIEMRRLSADMVSVVQMVGYSRRPYLTTLMISTAGSSYSTIWTDRRRCLAVGAEPLVRNQGEGDRQRG